MQTQPHAAGIVGPRGSGQESFDALEDSLAQDRRMLRRNSGRIIGVDYATFSFPAHTRVASRPKSPAPAVATLFGLPATLRAET